MKLRKAVVAGIAGLLLAGGVSAVSLAQPAAGAAAADSEALFAARCKSCHEPAIARAPSREQLRGLPNPQIIEALSGGVMKPMADGSRPRSPGALLTGRAAGAGGAAGPARPAAAGPEADAAAARAGQGVR
jgi:cytochrome c553